MLAKRGLAWRNRWNTSGTPGTPTVLAKRGLACWNTSKSTSSINSRKYREIPGTWHVSPERGLTEQIQVFYRGRPAAALHPLHRLQRCSSRCTRSSAAAAARCSPLLLQLAAARCCSAFGRRGAQTGAEQDWKSVRPLLAEVCNCAFCSRSIVDCRFGSTGTTRNGLHPTAKTRVTGAKLYFQ